MCQKQDNRAFISGVLRRFNTEEPVEFLKLNTIVNNIECLALKLWSFLTALI